MTIRSDIRRRWMLLRPHLNQHQQALWAAVEAQVIGRGGLSILERVTRISTETISRRAQQSKLIKSTRNSGLARCPGPPNDDLRNPQIAAALELVVREEIARHPTGRKKCLRGSLGMLCRALKERGHCVEPNTVSKILRRLGYRLKMTQGRKLTEMLDPDIESALQGLLSEEIAGDSMGRQRWVRSSLRNLSRRLEEQGHSACTHTVARLLRKMGYSLQIAQKQRAGAQHPDRDRQFKYMAELKANFLRDGLPVVSVDSKKKELIGNYRGEGRNWRREPIEVDAHFAGYAQCTPDEVRSGRCRRDGEHFAGKTL